MKLKLLNKEEFDKLTNPEKRVAIAKDVIARIDANLIKPFSGSLFANRDSVFKMDSTPQENFNNKKCEVCAKGALMCSWIGNFNEYDHWQVAAMDYGLDTKDNTYPVELLDIFGREMLDDIEAAFEGFVYCWHYDYEKYKKILFVRDYDLECDKTYQHNMKGIMQNIIDNNGEFIFEL